MNRGAKTEAGKEKGNLKWWQLSLLGVASTIGTGYFLGSALGIRLGGPAFLLSIILAATATYFVFDVLARMTAEDPQKARSEPTPKSLRPVGRLLNRMDVLVLRSVDHGKPDDGTGDFLPLLVSWRSDVDIRIRLCRTGAFVIWIGNKGFDRLENVLAVIKVAAIVMFLVIAAAAWMGWLKGGTKPHVPGSMNALFPTGGKGVWSSLIFAFYAFGGIEVMGVMAVRLKNPKEAPKSGKVMILLLSIVYVLSIGLAVMMVAWNRFSTTKSPFVVALSSYQLPLSPIYSMRS